jgi:hypothetical protein
MRTEVRAPIEKPPLGTRLSLASDTLSESTRECANFYSEGVLSDSFFVMHKLKKMAENSWLNLFVALILAATAMSELSETLWDDLASGNARVHHGILLYAMLSGLKAIPELFEAGERVSRD